MLHDDDRTCAMPGCLWPVSGDDIYCETCLEFAENEAIPAYDTFQSDISKKGEGILG